MRGEVVLFADTFNRYFEPENIEAAIAVLTAGGYQIHLARPADGGRPLCCGRTFLAVGKTKEARREAERTLTALAPHLARGLPIIGLEPSCLFSFRDEIPSLLKNGTAKQAASRALLFEEFLAGEAAAGTLDIKFEPAKNRALLHGHFHARWENCRCCRRSAKRPAMPSSSPMGLHAGSRSAMAPAAKRCMSPACSPRRLHRNCPLPKHIHDRQHKLFALRMR